MPQVRFSKPDLDSRVCINSRCRIQFQPTNGRQIYCTRNCRERHAESRRRFRVNKGDCYTCKRSRVGSKKFCEFHSRLDQSSHKAWVSERRSESRCLRCGNRKGRDGSDQYCGQCLQKTAAYQKRVRAERRSRGLCYCGQEAETGYKQCSRHRIANAQPFKRIYEARRAEAVCTRCGNADVGRYASCLNCRTRRAQRRKKTAKL